MQDSDDYDYFDEITEADLAVAEEVENKYLESQRSQAIQREPSGSEQPPTKRQKTGHAWGVANGVNGLPGALVLNAGKETNGRLARSSSLHSAAAILPDVPLANGYFKETVEFDRRRFSPTPHNRAIPQQPPQPLRPEITQQSSLVRNNPHAAPQAQRPPQIAKPTPVHRAPAPLAARPSLAQRAPTPPVPRPISTQPRSSPSTSTSRAFSRAATPPISRAPIQRTSTLLASRPIPAQRQPPGLRETITSPDDRLQKELEEMRLQLEALRQEQAQMQQTLRQAEDVRMAKEGEVSILRKGIQKTAQEHAAEVAKIKAAKEAAEVMQLKIQNEKKEEIDRLKTQYTFKQHELETSGRNSPWSARSRKISRQMPPSPVRMPSQMREWNPLGIDSNSTGLLSFNGAITSTQEVNGTKKGPGPKQQRTETAADKPRIPGFVNAFDSPPKPSSQTAKGRGKQREDMWMSSTEELDKTYLSQQVSPPRFNQSPPSPPSSPLGHKQARKNGRQLQLGSQGHVGQVETQIQPPLIHDVEMFDAQQEEAEAEAEAEADAEAGTGAGAIEELPAADWAAEVHRIILTHRRPSSMQLTMRLLMGDCIPDNAPQEHREVYARLSKSLLENMAIMLSDLLDADCAIRIVLDIIVRMADTLQACSAIVALTSLVNMLRVLVLWLPEFSRLMFVRPEGEEDAGDMMFEVVCRIVCTHLAPTEGEWSGDLDELARETLALLEDIAWSIPEEYESHLAFVPTHQEVMSVLLAPSHPTWFLHHSVRVLVLIASHHSIFRSLLFVPDPQTDAGDAAAPKDFSKIPHIEQMAVYLRDTTRTGAEADQLRDTIMTFVATLCMAHTDAITILQGSQLLVPSIIVFLSEFTTPLFEEDPELLDVPERLTATVMRAARTVSVVYTLVYAGDSMLDLYAKFRKATRDIPSMYDIAVVTLSRLSWADPPIEASDEARSILDQAIDLSRVLLDLFVEDSLMELVWSAFQPKDEIKRPTQGIRDVDMDAEENEEEAELGLPPGSQEL